MKCCIYPKVWNTRIKLNWKFLSYHDHVIRRILRSLKRVYLSVSHTQVEFLKSPVFRLEQIKKAKNTKLYHLDVLGKSTRADHKNVSYVWCNFMFWSLLWMSPTTVTPHFPIFEPYPRYLSWYPHLMSTCFLSTFFTLWIHPSPSSPCSKINNRSMQSSLSPLPLATGTSEISAVNRAPEPYPSFAM